jgi:hypothetical protein
MYTITKISETIESDIYDIKIPLSMKDEIINNYKLEPYGPVKEYWINNVKIISNNDGFLFDYFIDENSEIDLDLNILIEKYEKVESQSFNFYDSDIEEAYELYQKKNKEYLVQMKIYENYLVLELSSENLSEIKNNIL